MLDSDRVSKILPLLLTPKLIASTSAFYPSFLHTIIISYFYNVTKDDLAKRSKSIIFTHLLCSTSAKWRLLCC